MSSIAATSYPAIVQEAVAEALIKARDLGFRQVLLLTDCKRLAQVCNMKGQPKWQEQSMMKYLQCLTQHGLTIHTIFVPKLISNLNSLVYSTSVPLDPNSV